MTGSSNDSCRVESVVSLDPRGQMVLPKDVREKAGFGPHEKLAVVSWTRGSEVCCVTLQRADDLADLVRRRYGPLLANARPG
jgi:antitoxin PrlF